MDSMDYKNMKNFLLQYFFNVAEGRVSHENDSKACIKCGTTFGGFKKSGKLGCGYCYTTFREQLSQALKNIHRDNAHKGKIPQGAYGKYSDLVYRRDLEESRVLLKKAVDEERFEEAAKYRDIIIDLMAKIGDE